MHAAHKHNQIYPLLGARTRLDEKRYRRKKLGKTLEKGLEIGRCWKTLGILEMWRMHRQEEVWAMFGGKGSSQLLSISIFFGTGLSSCFSTGRRRLLDAAQGRLLLLLLLLLLHRVGGRPLVALLLLLLLPRDRRRVYNWRVHHGDGVVLAVVERVGRAVDGLFLFGGRCLNRGGGGLAPEGLETLLGRG